MCQTGRSSAFFGKRGPMKAIPGHLDRGVFTPSPCLAHDRADEEP